MNRIEILAVVAIAFAASSLPASPPKEELRRAAHEIDAILDAHWKTAKIAPNAPVTDEVFLRHVYLDLAGRIPTFAEAQAFLASTEPHKREALVDDLLNRESYVWNFYHFWADILRLKSYFVNTANVVSAAYEAYVKESLRTNKPYDQWVREMLGARGFSWDNPAIGYYLRDPEMPLDNMSLTTRIFLGTRIECAQCHDHPFDKWKQTEFYRLAAYTYANRAIGETFTASRDAIQRRQQVILDDFKKEKAASKDGGKAAEAKKNERLDAMEYRKIVGIIKAAVGQLLSPIGLERRANVVLKLPFDFHQPDGKPGDVMTPAPIFGTAPTLRTGDDSAEVFARWLTAPENPTFTKVIANRLWRKLFGVANVEPLDDLRDDSPAMVPELEPVLEKLMISLNYDMKAFLAVVARTRAYQSAASREEYARGSTYHFPGPLLRRMTAEQVWDSIVALASHEPDARDRTREDRNARRIAISHMVADAYLTFDGTRLVDMAYARLAAEKEWDTRDKAVKEALIVAKRAGDKDKELELRRKEGALRREHSEAMVKDFLMPVLENLVRVKAGPNAKPTEDTAYKINPNPAVLAIETWRKMYVPGYGPTLRTSAEQAAEAQATKRNLEARAATLGIPESQRAAFVTYCTNAAAEWRRASEMESPAPRGHFLRTMGQSDRDFVENANPNASIPQALALMNGDLISKKGVLSPFSPLMRAVSAASDPVDAAYVALLSRRPTSRERAVWDKAAAGGAPIEDLLYAILNTKQFLFVQ